MSFIKPDQPYYWKQRRFSESDWSAVIDLGSSSPPRSLTVEHLIELISEYETCGFEYHVLTIGSEVGLLFDDELDQDSIHPSRIFRPTSMLEYYDLIRAEKYFQTGGMS